MRYSCLYEYKLLILRLLNKKNTIMKTKVANITVTVKTYFKDGHYRNNTVELTIPEEAAKMISDAWSTLTKESSFLAKNQSADCFVEVDGEVAAGISQMPTRHTVDEIWEIEGKNDEEEDDEEA